MKARTQAIGAALGVIAVILLIGVAVSWVSVAEGTEKVVTVKGDAQTALQPGEWYFIEPISKSTHQISTRPQIYEMVRTQQQGEKSGDDSIKVVTADEETVPIDVAVNYRVTNSVVFFQKYRSHERARRVAIRTTVRDAAYTEAGAINLTDISSRSGRVRLKDAMRKALVQDMRGSGVKIISIDVRGVYLPKDYLNAVSKKNQKQQDLERERVESQRKLVEARADAEANRIVSRSLTKPVLQQKYINSLDKSDTVYIPVSQQNGLPTYLDVNSTQNNGGNQTGGAAG